MRFIAVFMMVDMYGRLKSSLVELRTLKGIKKSA